MADRDTNLGHIAWSKTHTLTGQRYETQTPYVCPLPEVLDSTEFAPEEVAKATISARRAAKLAAGFHSTLF